jgi:hypothetical protein
MATPFEDIYGFFLSKVTDFSFTNYTDEELEDELEQFLRIASVKFFSAGESRLQKDLSFKEFSNDLTDLEKEILASLMVVEYLNPKIIATENMKQFLASSEYKLYSQANHLGKMIELRNQVKSEVNYLMSLYSYKDGIAGMD